MERRDALSGAHPFPIFHFSFYVPILDDLGILKRVQNDGVGAGMTVKGLRREDKLDAAMTVREMEMNIECQNDNPKIINGSKW